MNKKVTLIIPPSPFLLDERVFVSLGVLRVASSLEQMNIRVGVLDLSGINNFLDAVSSYVKDNDNDWIGITCTTPQLPSAVAISKTIKNIKPNAKIVLGGPHVTLTYSAKKLEIKNNVVNGRAQKAATLLEQYFDHLVIGDGELIIKLLFNNDCEKILDADELNSPFFMRDKEYELSPWPARHLVDLKSYHYSIEGFPATSLIAQLGCPFKCGFCGGRNSKSLRVIRNRSVDSIIQEIQWLYETYGYTGFMFYDDELNVSKSFIELLNRLCKLQKDLNVEFRFRGFIKAELFNDNQARLMYQAGFRWILSGFESAHPRILKNIDKIATLEDNSNVVKLSHKYGLKVKALMSVGHPGETKESILAIRDWLIDQKIDDFDCTVITTYPGTPYYDLAQKNVDYDNVWTYSHHKTGDRLHSFDLDHTQIADYYKGNPNGGYKSYVFTDFLNNDEIVILRDQVEHAVRKNLGISFNPTGVALKFEHSMGQGLPEIIYKESQLHS